MGSYSASAQRLVDEMKAAALADPARGLAFQGAPGANSDLAARQYDPAALPLPCYAFEDAIEAVREGRVDRAIIPIENSLHGRVADIHFLLPESGLSIVGEHFLDRKSTRLNSSHVKISYAVFCLKKKKSIEDAQQIAYS